MAVTVQVIARDVRGWVYDCSTARHGCNMMLPCSTVGAIVDFSNGDSYPSCLWKIRMKCSLSPVNALP